MERTAEFREVVTLMGAVAGQKEGVGKPSAGAKGMAMEVTAAAVAVPPSAFGAAAHALSLSLRAGEGLLARLRGLVERKEFSNDPSQEVSQVAALFQQDGKNIQTQLEALQRLGGSSGGGGQYAQHCAFVVSCLKRLAGKQVEEFQRLLRRHSANVKSRVQRTSKYFHSHAMPVFQPGQMPMAALRRRPGAAAAVGGGDGTTALNGSHGGPHHLGAAGVAGASLAVREHQEYQQQQQQHQQQQQLYSASAKHRLESAHQIESTLHSLAQVFGEMASLVANQSETLHRIEDDVEEALQDTEEGHEQILHFYQLVKGSRSMIFKIFALLIFFILLFAYFSR